MLIHRIKLQNVLSFGPDAQELELKPLNVLIGPNGSGKSNLIEVIRLLKAAPEDLTVPIIDGGGISNWIWKGDPQASSAQVETVLDYQDGLTDLRHYLAFGRNNQRFELTEERIENTEAYPESDDPEVHFERNGNRATLTSSIKERQSLQPEDLSSRQSVLAQRRDPFFYPALTWLSDRYLPMRVYSEWAFGRNTPARLPQDAALPNDFLMQSGKNLGLVLNRLRREPKAKDEFLKALHELYEGVVDFDVIIEGGTVQVILQEGDIIVPSIRLSDGTLRYLCLLAILCHPKPPPLICLEEPELGLHPDILPGLAELLRMASKRCQLIVTTHSDVLVDALTDTPESIVVCEKHKGQTKMKRLDKTDMEHWLEKYRLGELWTSGELGGNRW